MVERDLGKCALCSRQLHMTYGELAVYLKIYQCTCEKLLQLVTEYGLTTIIQSRYNPHMLEKICIEQRIDIHAAPAETVHQLKGFIVRESETELGYNYFTTVMENGLKIGTYKSLEIASAMGRKQRNRERALTWQ